MVYKKIKSPRANLLSRFSTGYPPNTCGLAKCWLARDNSHKQYALLTIRSSNPLFENLGDTRIGQPYVCETKVTQRYNSPVSPSADGWSIPTPFHPSDKGPRTPFGRWERRRDVRAVCESMPQPYSGDFNLGGDRGYMQIHSR